jgi:cardiolipin synthase
MSRLLTLANLLTVSRMILIPVFVTCVVYHRLHLGLIVWVVAGTTDLLDGLLARKLGQQTSLGRILDPMADKLLLTTAFVVLSFSNFGFEPIPFWLTATVISRDVFIALGALLIFMTTGFSGFRPSSPGKVNTAVQLAMVTLFLMANILKSYTDLLPPLYYLTFGMAVVSGVHYIFHATRLVNEKDNANQ